MATSEKLLRAVLTRPASRQADLCEHLTATGWEVLCLPALELVPLEVVSVQPEYHPSRFDWIVFVSRTAWQVYASGLGGAWSSHTGIAAVGQGTAGVVRRDFLEDRMRIDHGHNYENGLPDMVTPVAGDSQDSEGLWRALEPRIKTQSRVLVVAGRDGRTWLRDQISQSGHACEVLEVYERRVAPIDVSCADRLRQWHQDGRAGCAGAWLFTSAHGIRAITQTLHSLDILSTLWPDGVVVTHPRLVAPARRWLEQTRAGPEVPVLVCEPEIHHLVWVFDQWRQNITI